MKLFVLLNSEGMFVIVICTIVEGLGNCSGINRAIKLSYRSINSSAYMLGKVLDDLSEF